MGNEQRNRYSLSSSAATSFKGGELLTADSSTFPALDGLSLQHLRMDAGGVREFHIHPNAAQMDFTISGEGRIGLVGPGREVQLLDMSEGDVSFIPQGYGHWIENVGQSELRMILVVNNANPETIFLTDMIRSLPGDAVERAYGSWQGLIDS